MYKFFTASSCFLSFCHIYIYIYIFYALHFHELNHNFLLCRQVSPDLHKFNVVISYAIFQCNFLLMIVK